MLALVLALDPPTPVLVLALFVVEPPAPEVVLPVVKSLLHPVDRADEAASAAAMVIEIERLFMGELRVPAAGWLHRGDTTEDASEAAPRMDAACSTEK